MILIHSNIQRTLAKSVEHTMKHTRFEHQVFCCEFLSSSRIECNHCIGLGSPKHHADWLFNLAASEPHLICGPILNNKALGATVNKLDVNTTNAS